MRFREKEVNVGRICQSDNEIIFENSGNFRHSERPRKNLANVTSAGEGEITAKQLGSGATHVALCNNIGLYFIHLCKVLAARFLDVGRICQSDNETDLDAKMPRGLDACGFG